MEQDVRLLEAAQKQQKLKRYFLIFCVCMIVAILLAVPAHWYVVLIEVLVKNVINIIIVSIAVFVSIVITKNIIK